MNEFGVMRIIDEARGFLNGVRLLCVPEAIAWIAYYPINDSESGYHEAPDSDIQIVQKRLISGREARKFLWSNLFGKVAATESQKKELEWRLKDYVNLAADADSGVVPSFVLWGNDAMFLSLTSTEYDLHGSVVYTLTSHVIVITLGNAAEK